MKEMFEQENTEDLLEPDDEELEETVVRTNIELEKPIGSYMLYAAAEEDTFSFKRFAERTPYGSAAADVETLIENNFLELEGYSLDRYADKAPEDLIEPRTAGAKTYEILEDIELEDSESYNTDKMSLPGIQDAGLSLAEKGKKYVETRGIENASREVLEACERKAPIGARSSQLNL